MDALLLPSTSFPGFSPDVRPSSWLPSEAGPSARLQEVTLHTCRWLYSHARPGSKLGQVKRSRRNFEAGQAVKRSVEASLETVKGSPGARWAWLMPNSQGSRSNFQCGQGVKHENLMGQDLDPGRGWEYRRLRSVTPLYNGLFQMNYEDTALWRKID